MKRIVTLIMVAAGYTLIAWEPVMMKCVEGEPWNVMVTESGGKTWTLEVKKPDYISVTRERYEKFPDYTPEGWGGWGKGVRLRQLHAQECSSAGALEPESVRIESEDGVLYEAGRDYDGNSEWGSFGRLKEGRIPPNATVLISYRYSPQRLDSVICNTAGKLSIRCGKPHMAVPLPPELEAGEVRVGNIYLCGRPKQLTEEMLFPVLETAYPENAKLGETAAALLPKTLEKLRSGKAVKVLAWGDSVTDGSFLADPSWRWQEVFVAGLSKRFATKNIELVTVGWGGASTRSYFTAPSGDFFNYQKRVLDESPDLVIMEFVNDAFLPQEELEANYGRAYRDLKRIGAELILLTPHYIRPDWMGLKSQRNIDRDPRRYVAFLRKFAAANNIAIADASLRYGRLWRRGIPYNTLMQNKVNHPDKRGMKLFSESLLELFPEK